jgi:MFS family permease
MRDIWELVPDMGLTLTLVATFFGVTLALSSIEPIVTVYVTHLSQHASHVALLAGLAFSVSGLASLLVASRLGRLSDKIGPQKVMLASLIAGAVIFIPQAFVHSPWQLIALRFMLGLATAGLAPSANALLKRITPDAITGRIFGVSISAQYLGIFSGSILGGQVAAYFGIRDVFFITSILLLMNAWLVYGKVCKKLPGAISTLSRKHCDKQQVVDSS